MYHFLYVLFIETNKIFCFRSGPILQITWDEFEEIASTNKELTTNQHKTGKFYTVHIYIQDDQRAFLRKMKAKYVEEYKSEPIFLFSSSVNKVESSISRGLQEVFLQKFGDDPALVRFNSNSIRKFWESMWTVIKPNVSEGSTELTWPKLPTPRRPPMKNTYPKTGRAASE